MRTINYPSYRSHEKQRIQTNDTMMGLLVGSKLAAATLELTAGSTVTLSKMFPTVEHIRRFDHVADTARDVLSDAEPLLGIMAVPFVLGLHEDLIVGMLKMVNAEANMRVPGLDGAKASNMHSKFESSTGAKFPPELTELFHLVRVMRNTHIHNGGRADNVLRNRASTISAQAKTTWTQITGHAAPIFSSGDDVRLGLPELIGSLAVTKRLADEANIVLQTALARQTWLKILKEDWLTSVAFKGNPQQRLKSLGGFARMYYAPLNFTKTEIETIA
ncbi:hypothetical protein [Arthrobacter oryzae]|uniref:hypothetical protein n=1 Tax=Arthrobacter oryzae TaxID=409290 RepID=UPI00285C2530|nr:hypothetical protein [Arthrobacter oryzae]MDR6507726.1 hypothetical protein [Arthrobacter oryzae]